MVEYIFSILLMTALVVGGIWGIYIKIKALREYVRKNGWGLVGSKILYFFIIIILVSSYLSGFVIIPLYFESILDNDNYVFLFIFVYLFFGAVIYWYANGTKRRQTKNIKFIFKRDLIDFKKRFKEFIQGIGMIAKGILILIGWLLAIGAIILAFILFGWFIASLSATTIIIILLVFILFK